MHADFCMAGSPGQTPQLSELAVSSSGPLYNLSLIKVLNSAWLGRQVEPHNYPNFLCHRVEEPKYDTCLLLLR